MSPRHLAQVQVHSLNEFRVGTHEAIELRAIGQGGEGIAQMSVCIEVEAPFASEPGEAGEDGEGDDLAGAQGGIGSGMLLFLRLGVAKVVHEDVECGEEGVMSVKFCRLAGC